MALRLDYVARPNERSVHRRPVPYMGGVAMFLAFVLAVLAAGLLESPEMGALVAGGAAIVLLGAIDDYRPLPAWAKAVGQAAVALGVALMGIRIDHVTSPFGGLVPLGAWGVPITVVWIWVVVNIINLADGLDGLAAGITAIAATTMLVAAIITDQPLAAALLCAALAGASLGFLPYNFNPAKIFMGDAGSMFLGYVLATISIQGSLKSPAAITLAVPLLALGVPLFDFVFAVVRRWRAGRPIALADRGHVHHRLLNLGLSQRETVLLLYCVSGWLAIGSLAIVRLPVLVSTLVLAFVGFTVYVAATVLRQRGRGAGSWEDGPGGRSAGA
ncbi:MAG: undecaprenyl/decaprenyl-phosphate alpha-N-acetylglucosaminyl 1-phosphate transferase [Clostridia bacterium]|nr:undecaprenyl/decaprenyl-phosphate alpha-N-acetylglucosaminyl 1-phosphate transferase [Clostridia bacterium]